MKIGVIGLGYVGLVTAACLANNGHQVIGADIDRSKIERLHRGQAPIYEEGLDELLAQARAQGTIEYMTDIAQAIKESTILFVAVGTPSLPDGSANLDYVWDICEQIATYGQDGQLIILKSTVPAGTTDAFAERLIQNNHTRFLDVIHNPEFLRQGQAVHDFLHPDRIVIGYENESVIPMINKLYHFSEAPIQFCRRTSAELIKYAANSFLAMKISYINMFSQLCEAFGADISDIAKGIGTDPRISPHFLQAGVGYGGSCFPKDIQALIQLAKAHGHTLPLLEATQQINRRQMTHFTEKLEQRLGTLDRKRIALLGLSFKPHTDDIREAPALRFCEICMAKGANILAYDPLVRAFPYAHVKLVSDPYACMEGANALVILTDWPEFRTLNWQRVCALLREPLLFDGRNLFSTQEIKFLSQSHPLEYHSIGRPHVKVFETAHQVR
ncbi:UDP-glucose dehydrogenase family protein [Laceyella putida]|uniref:UDP-glucose 6-dehydrogenase n=1 Tax=Laceyella putida TaxID=110101 RepID=A0ABW2RLL0_9BACL